MPVNYQDGKIYKIVNTENDTIYVGSTAQKLLSSRMSQHRRDILDPKRNTEWNVAMRTLGVDKFRIILIHHFPCTSKCELEAEEYKVLKALTDAGASVYNLKTAGNKHAEITKKRISASTRGALASAFNFGCIMFEPRKYSRWVFEWRDNGVSERKTFGITKHGFWTAKAMAEAARKKMYPDWKTDEELVIEQFLSLEWD